MLRAALVYAERGWPVFPCRPGSKAPATAHGFHDASTDPALITAWWTRAPSANVAIATGAPGPDVLDVDVKPDGNGFPAFNRLKRAGLLAGASMLVATRNGGLHVYFAGSDQPVRHLHRLHLDFQVRGAYVLAPPSLVPADEWATGTSAYELLDERASDARLDWAAVTRLLDPPRPVPDSRPTWSSAGRDVGSLVRWLVRQPAGNRNRALYWAACTACEAGLTHDLDQLVVAALEVGLDEREARRTVASAQRRTGGVTA